MENPIKMDDLGVPLFLETPIYPPKERENHIPPFTGFVRRNIIDSSGRFVGEDNIDSSQEGRN